MATVVTFDTPGVDAWEVPTGVVSVTLYVWAGGAGGASIGESNSGNGGGGGGFAKATVAVTPGDMLAVTVGAGGAVDSPGEGSVVEDGMAATLASADGGPDPNVSQAGASGTVGDDLFTGGDGAVFAGGDGGGGGGGGGELADGSNGSTFNGGAGGNSSGVPAEVIDGGAGGDGSQVIGLVDSTPGLQPGGGGGGGDGNSGGGDGLILIVYDGAEPYETEFTVGDELRAGENGVIPFETGLLADGVSSGTLSTGGPTIDRFVTRLWTAPYSYGGDESFDAYETALNLGPEQTSAPVEGYTTEIDIGTPARSAVPGTAAELWSGGYRR